LATNIAPTTSGRFSKVFYVTVLFHEANVPRNGRWRSLYILDPSSGALEGSLKVDVHYYEDGNVRLLTNKPVSSTISSINGTSIVKEISTTERKYQEELNKGFVSLSEGAFKGLRRQLPVTRQKIEWDRVTSYRLGQDIGGGSSRR
jgi:capping protein alpha